MMCACLFHNKYSIWKNYQKLPLTTKQEKYGNLHSDLYLYLVFYMLVCNAVSVLDASSVCLFTLRLRFFYGQVSRQVYRYGLCLSFH